MRYLNGETVTDLLYTGQKLEEELGLYYYVARWYDPYLNRFLSPDTIIPDPESLKSYDRYAYAYNNPLKFSDPSGHYGCTPGFDGGDCGGTGQETFSAVEAENERLAALQAYNQQRQAYLECGNGKCPGWNSHAEVLTWTTAGLVLAGGVSAVVSSIFTPATVQSTSTITTAACADGDCGNEVNSVASTAKSVWSQSPFARGNIIEQRLGGNLVRNNSIIDFWDDLSGIARSIKSIDLNATTYQNVNNLTNKITGYANTLANWSGNQLWNGVKITNSSIAAKELSVAIPPYVSAQQMQVLQQLQTTIYNQKGVVLIFVTIK